MTDKHPLDTVTDIMRATRIAVLTYVDEKGRLVSTPMGTQDFEEPGTVYFLTKKDTAKVAAISARPQVNVAYSSNEGWVSLTGTAALVDDRAKLKELWDVSADVFMEGDADDPDAGLLVVTGDTAEYWDSRGRVATAVQMVRGLVTDATPDLGDSGVVPV